MANLTEKEKKTLSYFIDDGPKSFTKLYSAKEHGCDAAEFHNRCDNRGPTVTLVYNVAGEVYGGYASISWQSVKATSVYDKKAFLFVLQNQEGSESNTFPLVNTPTKALLMDTSLGPTFGAGPDLLVFEDTIAKTEDGTFPLTSKMTPSSYDHLPRSIADLISGDANANDVAVFAVEDVSQNIQEIQWRSEPLFEKQYLNTLLEEVQTYWPLKTMGVSQEGLQNVNIMFIGPIGSGKSSFLNTVESVFRGYVTLSAAAGSRDKSVTSAYRQYPITALDNRRYLRFQLCDCRGLEEGFNLSRDIDAIIDGHMPNNYIFNSSSPLKSNMQGYRKDPSLKDKIHCVVYVLDAEKYSQDMGMSFMTVGVKEQIMEIQEKVDQRGIPQLILLNKVDNACPATKKKTSAVYRSPMIQERCYHAANCLGLPPMTVLPMRNHHMELATSDDVSILALYNIRQMLRAADTFLRVNYLESLRADKYEAPY